MELILDHDGDQKDRSQEVSEVDDENPEEEDSDTDEEEGPAEAYTFHERLCCDGERHASNSIHSNQRNQKKECAPRD